MIDDDSVDSAVVGKVIHQHCKFRIETLQTGLRLSVVESGDKRVDACLNKIIRPADGDAVGAARGDAVYAANRNGVRRNCENDSICAGGRDPVGVVDGKRVIRAARRDAIGVSEAASVGAAGCDAIDAGCNDVISAARGDAVRPGNGQTSQHRNRTQQNNQSQRDQSLSFLEKISYHQHKPSPRSGQDSGLLTTNQARLTIKRTKTTRILSYYYNALCCVRLAFPFLN